MKILDFTALLPGLYDTMVLAGLGAEPIHFESAVSIPYGECHPLLMHKETFLAVIPI